MKIVPARPEVLVSGVLSTGSAERERIAAWCDHEAIAEDPGIYEDPCEVAYSEGWIAAMRLVSEILREEENS